MLGFARTERGTPVRCNFCRKLIAARFADELVPSPLELTQMGATPMKQVGWFCSRRCVNDYEAHFRVILEAETSGTVQARFA